MMEVSNKLVEVPGVGFAWTSLFLISLPAMIYALVILLPRLRDDGKPPVQRLWFPVTLPLMMLGMGMQPGRSLAGHFTVVGGGMDFWQSLTAAVAVLAACWLVRFVLNSGLSGIVPVAAAFRAPSAPANTLLDI